MKQIAILLAAALLSCLASPLSAAESKTKKAGTRLAPKDIFGLTNIWTVHLRFTREQWDAMAPKEEQRSSAGKVSMLQGPEGSRNGAAVSFFGVNFNYVHADVEFGTNQYKDVGVRYKGNGTFLSAREDQKRSFKIDL